MLSLLQLLQCTAGQLVERLIPTHKTKTNSSTWKWFQLQKKKKEKKINSHSVETKGALPITINNTKIYYTVSTFTLLRFCTVFFYTYFTDQSQCQGKMIDLWLVDWYISTNFTFNERNRNLFY